MWSGIFRLTGQSVIPPGSGSIASTCEATHYMGYEKEYKKTKHLLVEHVCDKFDKTSK